MKLITGAIQTRGDRTFGEMQYWGKFAIRKLLDFAQQEQTSQFRIESVQGRLQQFVVDHSLGRGHVAIGRLELGQMNGRMTAAFAAMLQAFVYSNPIEPSPEVRSAFKLVNQLKHFQEYQLAHIGSVLPADHPHGQPKYLLVAALRGAAL
jgi:hypothetical protein